MKGVGEGLPPGEVVLPSPSTPGVQLSWWASKEALYSLLSSREGGMFSLCFTMRKGNSVALDMCNEATPENHTR